MSGRSLSQREASNARRFAQVAAIAGATLAVAALFLRLPGTGEKPADPEPIEWPEIKHSPEAQSDKRQTHDMNASATRLALVSNKPKTASHPPDGGSEISTPDQTGTIEVKYLGAVLEATRKIALLRVGDRQRMVAEGKTISLADGGTLEVVSVDAEGCVIRDGQGERRIEKSARTASAVTIITDAANSPASGAPISNPDAEAAGAATPEDMQRRRNEAEARMRALRDRAKAGGVKQ